MYYAYIYINKVYTLYSTHSKHPFTAGRVIPGETRCTVFARTKWLHFYKSPHRVLIIPSKTFRSRAAEQLHRRRRGLLLRARRTPPEHELRVHTSTGCTRIHLQNARTHTHTREYNTYTGWSVLQAYIHYNVYIHHTTHCSRKGITAADYIRRRRRGE